MRSSSLCGFLLGYTVGLVFLVLGCNSPETTPPPPPLKHDCPLTGESGTLERLDYATAYYVAPHSRFAIWRQDGSVFSADRVEASSCACGSKCACKASVPPTEAEMNGVIPFKRRGDLP